MALFNRIPPTPIKLTLKSDRLKDLKRGHPWVYGTSLKTLPPAAPGSFAVVRDTDSKIIAKGMYDPSSPIAFRVCALQEELTDQSISNKIQGAIIRRSSILSPDTTCCRLINGEGDLLPGFICDQFGDTAVIQIDGDGPRHFWNLEAIAELIAKNTPCKRVYFKPRSGSNEVARSLFGDIPAAPQQFLEHGALFEADLIEGQKSGFFLDQRENRKLIRQLSAERSVLNLFGYTGGFSIAAGLGGASTVTTVDIAKPAILNASRNWQLNNFDPSHHLGVSENAFDFLVSALKAKCCYDIVIADPPSFVPSRATLEKGKGAYVSIFTSSAQVVAAKGLLALSSCSSQVSPELFIEICQESISRARRRGTVLHISGQPLDHPFPLACRELQYLKFILFQLD